MKVWPTVQGPMQHMIDLGSYLHVNVLIMGI